MSLPRFLHRVAAEIRAAVDPDRIVLFGSWAKGRANARSDADFLVIGEFGGRRTQVLHALQDIAGAYPVGMDFHCVTAEDIARALGNPGSFYDSAMRTGVVLFDRKGLPECVQSDTI